jgi:hypothetical protein
MKWMVAMAGAAALTTACAQAPQEPVDRLDRTRTSEDVQVNNPGDELDSLTLFGDGFIEAVGARLDGAIGPATGLNSNAESVSFYDDGFYTQANVIAQGSGGAGMAIFSLNGSVRALDEAGGVRTCQNDFYDPNSDVNNGGVFASVTGCANSGDVDDGWAYDMPADCTDVSIDEPLEGAPEGAIATLSVLAHWSEATNGYERTVKATIHLTER